MLFFWSLLAFALLFILLWLIFVADDDTVLQTLRIPADGDVDGDGDVDAADVAALKASSEQEKLSAPARIAAMDARYEAASDTAAASAAVAEAAEASMEAEASGSAEAVAAAQDAIEAADAAVAEAAEAIEEAAAAVDATQDKALEEIRAESAHQEIAAAGPVVEVPESEVEEVTRAVTVFDETSKNYPDDLTKIDGIGEVYQRRLYAAGITTWAKVADADVAQLESLAQASEGAHVAEWPAQARALAEANDRVGAVYIGPMPDRLIVLPGIGEGTQQMLREHGLVSYVQIAETDLAVLAAVLKSANSRANAEEVVAAAKAMAEKSA
jgi:predicted flap endonuclease-1-like 5' DNA nuclease